LRILREHLQRRGISACAQRIARYDTCCQRFIIGNRQRSNVVMTLSARTIVVAALILGWHSNSSAQAPVFRSATELVSLNVSVVGANARPVTGLRQDQFAVFEDGVAQTLKFFAPGDLPLDVVILIDTSASMGTSMPLVQQAASQFAHALRPGDRATVMGISGGLRVLQTLTADIAAVDRAIHGTTAGGRTPLYSSIYTALIELAKIRRAEDATVRRQAIVVLSDGHDTASVFGFDDLMSTVRLQAVPIYTIAPRPSRVVKAQREAAFGETTHEQDYELRTLAAETGARAFFPVTLQELAGVYDTIASELAHQYSLGYHSSNPDRTGAFRRISLRVTAPGVKWRTRAGYRPGGGAATLGDAPNP
jgi:Ca-activated chloride channel family protein